MSKMYDPSDELDVRSPEREEHRCAWGPRCVDADTRAINPVTGEPTRKGALVVDALLCDSCMTKLRHAVKGMPRDYQRLSDAIGERRPSDGPKVTMTLSPEIPINIYREMLIARLVDLVDRAAHAVEEEMRMTGKNRHRTNQPAVAGHGYAAVRGENPDGRTTVTRATEFLLTSLDVLVEVENEWHLVWGPIPDSDEEWDRYDHGQPRDLVEMDGIDIALQIVDLSRAVYDEMGLARLRHHEPMPCPAVDHTGKSCGNYTVGRNDGKAEFNCTTCGAIWTEREYGWLVGRVLDEIKEQKEMEVLTWLLAEAYWRLDTLRVRVAVLDIEALCTDTTQAVEVVEVITSQLANVLDMGASPHPTFEERATEQKDAHRAIVK